MKKNLSKISIVLFISVAAIVFAVFGLAALFTHAVGGSFFFDLIILGIAALFTGAILILGLSAFSPIFSDALIVMRQLLRFESLSNPLLLRLSQEAPGTFHHVINVSILAQKAAKSIGADTLLVRIGAYYHDLGKLYQPELFIENQSGDEIPHSEDSETIRRDAQRIIAHVKKGIEIAVVNHLPNELVSIITEHHGTTKMLYFYEEAKRQGLKVRKTDFKYDGPVPQSKESAIIMLSDSVEAAARAVTFLTKETIVEIVESTILDKINEGQLKSSGLSETDFALIKSSLIDTLGSIYHQRIMVNRNA